MENNKIILYPKYVEDFKCDGTKCNAKCCGHWRIYIDRESYKKYQRIKNPAMRRKILSALQPCDVTQGFEVTLGKNLLCPLLCADCLCYIQRNLGEEYLSDVCRIYPRMTRHLGELQINLLSMTCPVAAEHALFSPDGMEIVLGENKFEAAAWKIANINSKKITCSNTMFAANVILGGLSILQNTAYSREQRLVMLGLFLQKANDLNENLDALSELIEYYNSGEFRKEDAFLWDNWTFYPTAHRQFMAGILKILHEAGKIVMHRTLNNVNDEYENIYVRERHLLEKNAGTLFDRFLQYEWLYHVFPFAVEGDFLHNYFAFLLNYKIAELFFYGFFSFQKSVDKDRFIHKLEIILQLMDHREDYLETLVKETAIFEKEPLKLMQVLLRIK